MQQGDSTNPYYQYHHPQFQNPNPNPNPNPNDHQMSSYASAPPFAPNFNPSDYPNYNYNPDQAPKLPPSAPSYAPNPNLQSFNPNFPNFSPAPEPQPPYPTPTQQPSFYFPYDQQQTMPTPSYVPPASIPQNPSANLSPNSSFSGVEAYSNAYPQSGSSGAPVYESSAKFDQRGSYLDDNLSGYGGQGGFERSRSDLGSKIRSDLGMDGAFRYGGANDDGVGNGVYAYDGGKHEPYGARGTGLKSSTWSTTFDDYGRSVNLSSGNDRLGSSKVVRAVPKMDTQEDAKSGVQKFRVKLLAESGGQSTMDVLCQIGFDGIRMLDPNSGRTLRIYPLETVTRSEVLDSSIFAFWSKTSVDFEPRRIRLKSSSYTTNTLLDTVTAATVQLKEMGGKESFRSKTYESGKVAEQPIEKKKSITDWVNIIKPANEEKDHWVPDEAVAKCTSCGSDFGAFLRKHHCRNCGDIFCDKCTQGRIALTADENAQPVRVCDRCMAEVTQRLNSSKESASKPAGVHSHEDLARKLQEEMDRNRKASSGSKSSSNGSGKRMKEVACPTCTVHLQVQVPTSGSETIECGVCQHPFLVSAH
ncbi:hypothetical protein GIB67_016144 [Kingdonia uniflora]|uniref:FYVE-type domain-containing protein n=1 Tax=Kingdonia uniflora TaxID=39325 RepID=A0A7J7N9V1_9MAGN|nr:hypothetical protein GIB67_016144 [Kingdonia uniflora]